MTWTTPRTWTTGETVTAAIMNAHVRDNFNAIGNAWTSYTPVVTGWTPGNGTAVGAYMQAGKAVSFRARFTLGSTTTIAGSFTMTLPIPTNIGFVGLLFTAVSNPASALGTMVGRCNTATTFQVYYPGTNGVIANPTTTLPGVWVSGNWVEVAGTYEAA